MTWRGATSFVRERTSLRFGIDLVPEMEPHEDVSNARSVMFEQVITVIMKRCP